MVFRIHLKCTDFQTLKQITRKIFLSIFAVYITAILTLDSHYLVKTKIDEIS